MKSRTQMIHLFACRIGIRCFSCLVMIIVTAMTGSSLLGQHCYLDSMQDCTLGGSTPCASNSCIQFWWDDQKAEWTQTEIPGAQTTVACAGSAFYFNNETGIPYAIVTEEGDQGKETIQVGETVTCSFWATCHCRGLMPGESCLFDQEVGAAEEITESEASGDDCDGFEM